MNLHLLHLECFDVVFFNRKSSHSTFAHLPRMVVKFEITGPGTCTHFNNDPTLTILVPFHFCH